MLTIAITLAQLAVLRAGPAEYLLDFSGWTGKQTVEIEARFRTMDGKVLAFAVEICSETDAESARDVFASPFPEPGWRLEKVGKDKLVVKGSLTSPLQNVTLESALWIPAVQRMPIAVPKEPKK